MNLYSYIMKSKFGKSIIAILLLSVAWILLIGSDDRPGFLRLKILPMLVQIQTSGSTTAVNAYGNWTFENVPTGVGGGGGDSTFPSARIDTLTLGNDVANVTGIIDILSDGGSSYRMSIGASDDALFTAATGGYKFDGALWGSSLKHLTTNSSLTLQTNGSGQVLIDIAAIAGVDGSVRIGDTGTELETVTIDSAGFVGIGTFSPVFPLHVTGDAALAGEGTALYLDSGSSGVEDHDIWIYFGNDGNDTANKFGMDDGVTFFFFSTGIKVDNGRIFGSSNNDEINLAGLWQTNSTNIKADPCLAGTGTFQSGDDGDQDTTFTNGVFRQLTVVGISAVNPGGQGDGALTADINEVSVVGTTDDAVTLPGAIAGRAVTIINNGANQLEIFPASGDNLGAGVNTATSLASGVNVTFLAYNTTNWEVK